MARWWEQLFFSFNSRAPGLTWMARACDSDSTVEPQLIVSQLIEQLGTSRAMKDAR